MRWLRGLTQGNGSILGRMSSVRRQIASDLMMANGKTISAPPTMKRYGQSLLRASIKSQDPLITLIKFTPQPSNRRTVIDVVITNSHGSKSEHRYETDLLTVENSAATADDLVTILVSRRDISQLCHGGLETLLQDGYSSVTFKSVSGVFDTSFEKKKEKESE